MYFSRTSRGLILFSRPAKKKEKIKVKNPVHFFYEHAFSSGL